MKVWYKDELKNMIIYGIKTWIKNTDFCYTATHISMTFRSGLKHKKKKKKGKPFQQAKNAFWRFIFQNIM